MPKQFQLLLFAFLITLQVSCVHSGSRGESHSNASAAADQARIDEILRRYEEVVGGNVEFEHRRRAVCAGVRHC